MLEYKCFLLICITKIYFFVRSGLMLLNLSQLDYIFFISVCRSIELNDRTLIVFHFKPGPIQLKLKSRHSRLQTNTSYPIEHKEINLFPYVSTCFDFVNKKPNSVLHWELAQRCVY